MRRFQSFVALTAGILFLVPGFALAADAPQGAGQSREAAPAIGPSKQDAAEEAAEKGDAKDNEASAVPPGKDRKFKIKYTRKGLDLGDRDGNYTARINWRAQIRYSTPFDAAPRDADDFDKAELTQFRFRRARFKVKGVAFRPWVQYAIEHDLVDNRFLTGELTIAPLDWLQLKVGQWKAHYNRERADSSGKQQFVERSIVTRPFTIDRQKGAMLTGRIMPGTRGDARYYAGVFAGTGRGTSGLDESDGTPMLVARYQWNFLKRDLPYSQSDIEGRQKPAASLAFGASSNRSRYTRFSSSGGGQIDGFEDGEVGQYSLRQYVQEAALHYKGFSFQQEFHWKRIVDNKNFTTTHLRGSYVQAGYFFHHLVSWIPKQLETAGRYAFVDYNTATPDDLLDEVTVVVNWFFWGHANKLSFDVSWLGLDRAVEADLLDTRYRAQWDISF
jgi:phosphate-selective porin